MGELLGCARVSTSEQSADGQVDALRAAGVKRVWSDVASGVRAQRPALAELMEASAASDVVVCRLASQPRSFATGSLPKPADTVSACWP